VQGASVQGYLPAAAGEPQHRAGNAGPRQAYLYARARLLSARGTGLRTAPR